MNQVEQAASSGASTSAPLQSKQASGIQPPEVMRSAAGYYVGCYIVVDGFPSPHSRYSDYYPKRGKAEEWLEKALAEGSL